MGIWRWAYGSVPPLTMNILFRHDHCKHIKKKVNISESEVS